MLPVQINQNVATSVLLDSGCLCYGLIDSRFARRHHLPRIDIEPRQFESVEAVADQPISSLAVLDLDVGGHRTRRAYVYVAPKLQGYDMILGLPWMRREGATLDAGANELRFVTGHAIKGPSTGWEPKMIGAAAFALSIKNRKKGVQVFAASMTDINKALAEKEHSDPKKKLPAWVAEKFLKLFDRSEADKLPPHRVGADHKIELDQDENGKEAEIPYEALRSMSQEQLLVLRKTLTDLLDKGFIRVSSSPAGAPILFVKKPGGGLRFCVDYRALNAITRKDRYPLPLIRETLNRIGKARWFTKLDVVSAFHKIRIAEGDEWKTAFRTRFGLYEWLVTPFGMANAPSTFQRYINWVLRDMLDDYVSAYVDDVLIFTEGSRQQHREQVRSVLERLEKAGLQLDVDKCEFEVQSTKYLGFIVEAGKGLRMDPLKIKAIEEWQAPTTAKGILGFLGFANFYRQFIDGFSRLSAPLSALTKKDARFVWSAKEQEAFDALKDAFITAPVLAMFDPERETVLETDSSGYVTGGTLSQLHGDALRPTAYFSKKNLPAECNYPIHDKELLAIIRCMEEWETELKSVGHFTVLTDHKNLEYFTTNQKLSERQVRWQQYLTQFDFVIRYRPGKNNGAPDALSRRQQDMPANEEDDRIAARTGIVVPSRLIKAASVRLQSRAGIAPRETIKASPVKTAGRRIELSHGEDKSGSGQSSLEEEWAGAIQQDDVYQQLLTAKESGKRTVPTELAGRARVSMADLSIESGRLQYRGRWWVPESEPLRTRLMQETHDSKLMGHPGKNGLVAILNRQYYWPMNGRDVQRFVSNCDGCRRTVPWRERRHGLLKPLPIPDRIWREISIDFVGPLPDSGNCQNVMVITDRLSKGVILEACSSMDMDYIARLFIRCFTRRHGVPDAITSDRGSQFVNGLWDRWTRILGIRKRLSTAWHPETDGATERLNAEVTRLLRLWGNYEQSNWEEWLPIVELALNNRVSSSLGLSPFFLCHGYDMDPVQLQVVEEQIGSARTEETRSHGEELAKRFAGVVEWTQARMAAVQQEMEGHANSHRQTSPEYRVGDKVWLSLRNIATERPSKKLDDRQAKYTVTEVVGPQSIRLDVPGTIHNVFNIDLLRPAASNPFPSQVQDDEQPPPVIVDGEPEWEVEHLAGERWKKVGRGYRHEFRVKWKGYSRELWYPARDFEATAALDSWRAHHVALKRPRREGGGIVRGSTPLEP